MPLPRPAPITAPGPTGAEMLRAIRRIRRDPVAFLQSVRDEHGGVAQFPIPRPPTYLVSDADAVRRVLVTNASAYGKRTLQYSTLALVTGDGLLTADTETWRPHRRILQPAFHHVAVAAVAGHVARAVDRVDRSWSARCQASAATRAVIDVDETMAHLALEVVGRALFGTDLTGDAARLTTATLQALDVVVGRARTPVSAPAWVPTPGNVRLGRAVARLDAAVTSMLAERAVAGTEPRAPDMLDLLLVGGELTPTQVRDEVVTFIVAGHETVAAALTWACYLLGRDPVAAQRLRDEVDGVAAGRDQPLEVADLDRLPYTRAVVDETLRLYPPAWLITRRAREDDVLAGVAVPRDALVIISPWLVHHDADLWSGPADFRPQRFLPEGGAPDQARSAYLPFGAGPRMCIGREMALLETVLALAGLARRFDITPVDAAPVRPLLAVTVRPDGGLRMLVRPRL